MVITSKSTRSVLTAPLVYFKLNLFVSARFHIKCCRVLRNAWIWFPRECFPTWPLSNVVSVGIKGNREFCFVFRFVFGGYEYTWYKSFCVTGLYKLIRLPDWTMESHLWNDSRSFEYLRWKRVRYLRTWY